MINLLPQNYKDLQNSKYKIRYFTVICGFIFGLSVLSLVFFIPAYVFTQVNADAVIVESQKVKERGPAESEIAKILVELTEASLLTAELNAKLPTSNVFDTLRALERKSPAISVNEILYTNKLGQDINIVIRGLAKTRDDLKSFADFLTVLPEFEKIDLPISNFTKERDIDFSLSAVVRRPDKLK